MFLFFFDLLGLLGLKIGQNIRAELEEQVQIITGITGLCQAVCRGLCHGLCQGLC